jgi:hypothetical protein
MFRIVCQEHLSAFQNDERGRCPVSCLYSLPLDDKRQITFAPAVSDAVRLDSAVVD